MSLETYISGLYVGRDRQQCDNPVQEIAVLFPGAMNLYYRPFCLQQRLPINGCLTGGKVGWVK